MLLTVLQGLDYIWDGDGHSTACETLRM